ncbi:conserved protein of unknown function [Listeria monocytogenes]|nr:conserved protein of unknown function [Listeria monocytogenes]
MKSSFASDIASVFACGIAINCCTAVAYSFSRAHKSRST